MSIDLRTEDEASPTEWGFLEGDPIAPGRTALKLLGGGRRYEAYLAWDDRRLTPVVVKVLRPHCVDSSSARYQIANEAAALDALQHPVLPRCFGSDLDGERPHLVLEFLEGPRLSTLLRRHGPLAVEQALPLALQVCAAVHYLAQEGWVHLDVKPKNIVMGAPPRLIDLSIATRIDRTRDLTEPTGTDDYMAPEQCEPWTGQIGPAADVWGLGVTLYEAITGRLPFAREPEDPATRWPQRTNEPVPFPDEFPAVLTAPILACLEKRPSDRPTAAQLAGILEPLSAVLPTPMILSKLRPRLGRRRD